MKIHLVDGTYELFRAYYGAPGRRDEAGIEVGAVVALLRTLFSLLRHRETSHLACAFDHVIESFRNELFDGYKTGEGIEPELKQQFLLAEKAVHAFGIVVWPMIEFEADDALATAASDRRILVVPVENAREAALATGCRVFAASSLAETLQLIEGGYSQQPVTGTTGYS